jgi:hypothetical protein
MDCTKSFEFLRLWDMDCTKSFEFLRLWAGFFFGFLDLGLMGGRGCASAVGCRRIPCSVQKS